MKKIIQISDKFFWGFNTIVNLDNYKSFEELEDLLKNELIIFLTKYNLLNQVDIAKKLKLHNHSFNSYEELYNTYDDVIYFCGDCCR